MAGKIVADTLEHSTAGSIATNYVVEGSLKAWVGAEVDATHQRSLNFSSSSDNGTGSYTHTLTNASSHQLDKSGLQLTAGGGTALPDMGTTTTASVVDFRFTIQVGVLLDIPTISTCWRVSMMQTPEFQGTHLLDRLCWAKENLEPHQS